SRHFERALVAGLLRLPLALCRRIGGMRRQGNQGGSQHQRRQYGEADGHRFFLKTSSGFCATSVGSAIWAAAARITSRPGPATTTASPLLITRKPRPWTSPFGPRPSTARSPQTKFLLNSTCAIWVVKR